MSLLNYLQLQPIDDPQDDGAVSDLNDYSEDETIDLFDDTDGTALIEEWEKISHDLHE